MLRQLGRMALTVALAATTLSGLAYAGTGSPDPIGAVVSALTDDQPAPDSSPAVFDDAATPSPTVTPEPDPTPTVTPEPDPTVTPEPEDTSEPAPSAQPTDAAKWSTSGCPDGFSGNHGQFVSSSEDKREAAHSDCGKPAASVDKQPQESSAPDDDDDDAESTQTNAHKTGKPDKAEKDHGHRGGPKKDG